MLTTFANPFSTGRAKVVEKGLNRRLSRGGEFSSAYEVRTRRMGPPDGGSSLQGRASGLVQRRSSGGERRFV